jgi:hypothetical protein
MVSAIAAGEEKTRFLGALGGPKISVAKRRVLMAQGKSRCANGVGVRAPRFSCCCVRHPTCALAAPRSFPASGGKRSSTANWRLQNTLTTGGGSASSSRHPRDRILGAVYGRASAEFGGPLRAAAEAPVGLRRPVTSFGLQMAAVARRKERIGGGGHVPSPRGGRRTRNRSTQFLMTPLISYIYKRTQIALSLCCCWRDAHFWIKCAFFGERCILLMASARCRRRPLSKNLKFEAQWLLNVNFLGGL